MTLLLHDCRSHGITDQAAIQDEQIVALGCIKCFEQHLSFASIGLAGCGVQADFCAWQIQDERVMIRSKIGTAPCGDTQTRAIGSDDAQAVPLMSIDQRCRDLQQGAIERNIGGNNPMLSSSSLRPHN